MFPHSTKMILPWKCPFERVHLCIRTENFERAAAQCTELIEIFCWRSLHC